MKCLTVCQPWASLIMDGRKRIENRTWSTTHRGILLIHAGSSRCFLGTDADRLIEDLDGVPYGCLLGTVQLLDCLPLSECRGEPFAEGPMCWRVENPVLLKTPIPYRGKLGLFDVPDEFVCDPAGYLMARFN